MNSTTRKIGAAFGLAAIAGFSVALPASAAVTASEWGVWGTENLAHDQTVTFENSAMPDAVVDISGDWDEYYTDSPDNSGEGFNAETPLGALFGDNTPSTVDQFLYATTMDDNVIEMIIDIDFEEAVPADQLVLAISDVDSDHAVVEMLDSTDTPLTGDEIIGSATDTGFNFCDVTTPPSSCGGDDNVPDVTADVDSALIDADEFGTDGVTGWVRPSSDVKHITITINTEDDNFSSERIWLGQVIEAADQPLAETGIDKSIYLGVIAGGALLAAGGFVGMRRRNS